MKKILLGLMLFGATTFGLSNVKAEVIDLNDIDTNTYIIGDRIYELNTFYLTVYDVVTATNEYANNHGGAIAPIYYLGETADGEKYLLEILGSADENGVVPTEIFEDIAVIYPDSKMDATAINNALLDDYTMEEIEPKIIAAVEKLNETAKEYGFKGVTYKNNTVTFEIEDLAASLENYKDSGIISLFMSTLDSATKINYTLDEAKEVDFTVLNETKITQLAKEILAYLAGDKELTYGAVANNSVTATVSFENDGKEYVETYTVEFIFDTTDAEENLEYIIEDAALVLNETAKDYGFSSIVSKNNKVTFNVADLDRNLEDYKNSGILALIMNYSEIGATLLEYNGEKFDLTVINETKLIQIAKTILTDLAGENLTYAGVIGKSATAKVTFEAAGFELVEEFTVEFLLDEEAAKAEVEEDIKTSIETLNETVTNYGFTSVTYENNKVTFNVADLDAELADAKTAIVTLIMSNLNGATSLEYNGEPTDLTVVNETKLVELAKTILTDLAGEDLTLGAVVGEGATVKVTYGEGEHSYTVEYNLEFVLDEEAAKAEVEEDIKASVNTLNETASNYGLSSVVYKDNKVTFNVVDLEKELADAKTAIVTLIMNNLNGATSLEYNGEPTDLTVVNETKLVELAKTILTDLAGEDLTYAGVVGEDATVKVTFGEGEHSYTVDYTLEFVYDFPSVKDETLKEVARDLNLNAGTYGFESIAYSAKDKKATFTVENPEAPLADFQNSGFISLFMTNLDGAVSATYEGAEEPVDLTVMSNIKLVELAKTVLGTIVEEGQELNLGAVAGKELSLDLTYDVNGVETVVTYTIEFVMGE